MNDDICTNCGHWKGLHHFETNQCPAGGEAPVGRKQNWLMSIYQAPDKRDATIAAQAATIAQLREVATAAREVMRKHDVKAVECNFTICGCDYCDAMRPQLAALEQETK